jgi:hypothetical protein
MTVLWILSSRQFNTRFSLSVVGLQLGMLNCLANQHRVDINKWLNSKFLFSHSILDMIWKIFYFIIINGLKIFFQNMSNNLWQTWQPALFCCLARPQCCLIGRCLQDSQSGGAQQISLLHLYLFYTAWSTQLCLMLSYADLLLQKSASEKLHL